MWPSLNFASFFVKPIPKGFISSGRVVVTSAATFLLLNVLENSLFSSWLTTSITQDHSLLKSFWCLLGVSFLVLLLMLNSHFQALLHFPRLWTVVGPGFQSLDLLIFSVYSLSLEISAVLTALDSIYMLMTHELASQLSILCWASDPTACLQSSQSHKHLKLFVLKTTKKVLLPNFSPAN